VQCGVPKRGLCINIQSRPFCEEHFGHITVAIFDRDEKRRLVPECLVDIDLLKGNESAGNFHMPPLGSRINGRCSRYIQI
jgi:hypothetical protein